MKKLSILTCLVALGLFMFSCGDDDADELAPVVTITAPTNGSTASPGDTISFGFTVTDDVSLNAIEISGTLGVSQSITSFDTDKSHEISNASIALDPSTPTGDQTITVAAQDGSGNNGEATVTVIIQ